MSIKVLIRHPDNGNARVVMMPMVPRVGELLAFTNPTTVANQNPLSALPAQLRVKSVGYTIHEWNGFDMATIETENI